MCCAVLTWLLPSLSIEPMDQSKAASNGNGGNGLNGHGGSLPARQTKAAQLKQELYSKDAKLSDLFGDLEPKMMLQSITDTFWVPWMHLE